MLALALIAALGTDGGIAPDAGFTPGLFAPVPTYSEALYASCPEAEPSIPVDGGWRLLPPSRVARVACLMETCDVDRQLKEEQLAGQAPPWWWWAAGVAFVAGIAGGVIGGYVWGQSQGQAPK